MSFSSDFRHITGHFRKTFRHHAGLQLAPMVVLISCFSIVAGVITVSQNLDRILTLWGESLEVSVYLTEEASDQQKQKIETALQTNEKIDKLKFVSKESALDMFRDQMASYAPDLMKDSDLLKVIPRSFQFAINAKVPAEDHLATTQTIANSLKTLAGVEDVSFGQDWVKSYAGIVQGVSVVGGLFSAIILLAVIFVVSNAVRTSISQRRYEIEVLELIGASARYIRQPYIWEGALTGGLSCGLAVVFSYAVFSTLKDHLKSQVALLQLSAHIQFLSPAVIMALIGASTVLGILASYSCVKVINDGWSASQRANRK